MSVEEPVAHLLLNLNPHPIFRLCWTNDVPCQPILTRKRSVGRILFIHVCWGCGALFSGWEVQKPQVFLLRGRERTGSCLDVGGRQFAFVTESKGSDSLRRQVQSTELSSQREGWKDRNRSHTRILPQKWPLGLGGDSCAPTGLRRDEHKDFGVLSAPRPSIPSPGVP